MEFCYPTTVTPNSTLLTQSLSPITQSLLQFLQRTVRKSAVIIFTNQTHSDFINSAFRHGADSYMLKSADVELIELAIKRAYFDESFLDPKLTKKVLESR
jgi:DNA-binding NarL/FixJ family response regulator